jgi:hypothetical protein
MSNHTESNHDLLNEIFAQPSSDIKTERFTTSSEAAPCGGTCSSGACRAVSQ